MKNMRAEENKEKKKEKRVYQDDGHTVYSMENLVGKENYNKKDKQVGLTKKEKKAAIKAAFETYVPILLGVLACFSFAMVLIYLWLK